MIILTLPLFLLIRLTLAMLSPLVKTTEGGARVVTINRELL
jgi:hypothetical protein